MTLIRHYKPSTRLDHYELEGLLNTLRQRVDDIEESGEVNAPYYIGAAIALHIVRYHEFVDVPADFIKLFDRQLQDMIGEDE